MILRFTDTSFLMEKYRKCNFTIVYPVINIFRVHSVDTIKKVIKLRQIKGKPPGDPRYFDNSESVLLSLDEDEISSNGNPLYFSVYTDKLILEFFNVRRSDATNIRITF